MDRERDYYAERRDRDRQSTRTLEVWKEGRLLEELDLTACRRYTVYGAASRTYSARLSF